MTNLSKNQWQPIETAPKDGAFFLAWEPGGLPSVTVAYFSTYENIDFLCYADEGLAELHPDGPEATHWMPLPAPPSP